MSPGDGAEDLVDGLLGGQGAVEDDEVPLQPLRDVVTAPAGLDHGREILHVHDRGEVAGFLQA